MEAVQDYKFSFLSDVHFVVRFSILGGIIEQKNNHQVFIYHGK